MSRTSRLSCVVAALALIVSAPCWSAELPEGFRLEPVLGGLTDPSALDRTADGRILIAERTTGNVRVVNHGTLQAAPLCTVGVNATGEGGLLGLAVHPDFASNGWLYLYYTSSSSNVNKVTRMTIAGGTCSGEIDILADLGAGGNFLRNGGGIAFGPDGRLYVAVGDMEDAGNAQDDLLLQGKVLRVEDIGGTPEIFAKGIRDGRGIDVRATGDVLMTDAGDDPTAVADELNPVPLGGNLGWDVPTGDVDPLAAWLPTIGIEGMSVYAASAFPDQIADGIDNDHDSFGADGWPGRFRKDDNGTGECVGGTNNGGSCIENSDCPPRSGETDVYCWDLDEAAEYCPGGTPLFDDVCGSTGAAGVDEPDESYLDNLFMASGNRVVRWVDGIADPDPGWSTFLDSTALPDCPTGWTDAMEGSDGLLYLVATNGGGGGGALYRVVYDVQAGPREVSAPGTHFPFLIEKGASEGDLVLYWEDLRTDAFQPRDNGSMPTDAEREYTIWSGDVGDYYTHTELLVGVEGNPVNDAVRSYALSGPGDDKYFLVSARHDNLEGTLGTGQAQRPGPAVIDLCNNLGYHESPSWNMWVCGQDFTLQDEMGEWHSLYDFRGRPIVLDLSAVWCGPCNTEADLLEFWLNQVYKDRGVQVLTALFDDAQGNNADRPNPPECRDWGHRGDYQLCEITRGPCLGGSDPCPWGEDEECTAVGELDHTFLCLSDPNPNQQSWPRYNANDSFVPQNIVLDQGLRVVYTDSGYDETAIKAMLDALVGTADVCLH